MKRFLYQAVPVFLIVILVSACAFKELREDIEIMQTVIGIGGDISNRSPHQRPLIVLIYSENESRIMIRNFTLIDKQEEFYAFNVPDGNYYILAFEDMNNNLAYDSGEYYGFFGQPDRIQVTGDEPIGNLNIVVNKSEDFPKGFPGDLSKTERLTDIKEIAMGKVVTLESSIFSDENAKAGFWQPITTLHNIGAGVYFLEDYDASRIPVLFVHGASGSPKHFKFLAENIDREKFQPWFYHYPSGFPLDKISQFLNLMITNLHERYQFNQLYITAHSMGGLVSRSFINKNMNEDGNTYIKLFVSISSPFGGLETAQMGVKSAPEAIPSWYDVVPDSPFITDLFSWKLKDSVDYYLFFGHKGDNSMFMDNNDGTVTLRSQLDMRAQEDAIARWGFDEGHVSILSSQDVLRHYNEILENTFKK